MHISFIIRGKIMSAEVREFYEFKENCRRLHMLKCVGSEQFNGANNYWQMLLVP